MNIILGSMTFWLGNVEQLSGVISEAIVTFSLYPNNIYKGIVKIILLSIIPAGYLGAIPLKIIQGEGYIYVFYLIGFTFVLFCLALKLFYSGLKRYESSNLININM